MSRKKLYCILLLLSVAGYGWLFYSYSGLNSHFWNGCLTRQLLHIPCPACGSTRSVHAIFHGHFAEAIQFNPFGYVLAGLMVLVPLWVVADFIRSSSSFYRFYHACEDLLRRPACAIPAILIVLANWIWNLQKYV